MNSSINELIGLDVNQFTQITMIAQGEFLKLIHASTKERSDIFRKIFNTKPYQQLQEKLKERFNALKKDFLLIDYCEPHTCAFNHKLGKQNSQRI